MLMIISGESYKIICWPMICILTEWKLLGGLILILFFFVIQKKKKNCWFLCKNLRGLIIVQPLIRPPCSDSLWDIVGEFDPHWVPVSCNLFVRLTFIRTQQMHSLVINENIQKSDPKWFRQILKFFSLFCTTLQTSVSNPFVVFGTIYYVFQPSSSAYVVWWKPPWQASFFSLIWWFPCKHQSRYLGGDAFYFLLMWWWGTVIETLKWC